MPWYNFSYSQPHRWWRKQKPVWLLKKFDLGKFGSSNSISLNQSFYTVHRVSSHCLQWREWFLSGSPKWWNECEIGEIGTRPYNAEAASVKHRSMNPFVDSEFESVTICDLLSLQCKTCESNLDSRILRILRPNNGSLWITDQNHWL